MKKKKIKKVNMKIKKSKFKHIGLDTFFRRNTDKNSILKDNIIFKDSIKKLDKMGIVDARDISKSLLKKYKKNKEINISADINSKIY